jgi:hypothetical protein
MAGLSSAHRTALTALLARCPDVALRAVSAAVASTAGSRAAEMRALIGEEIRDRERCEKALKPLVPMFRARADGIVAMTFPSHILPRLWRAASALEPDLIRHLDDDGPASTTVADRLCRAAANALRDQPELIWPPGGDEVARQKGLDDLTACLDLAHLARRGLPSLEIWLRRPDGDQIAELRLLFKDCAGARIDGAPRVLEMLFAHLPDAVLILRIVTLTSLVAGRDGFLSESEMSGFVDRLIGGVDLRAGRIKAFKPGSDLAQVDSVIADFNWCAGVLGELDVTLSFDPRSAWGKSVRDARATIAGRMSSLLREADKAVTRALPMERVQFGGRMAREMPRLSAPVEGPAVEAALSLLSLVGSACGPASVFGCEADRKTLVVALGDRLLDYADQTLRMIREGAVEGETHAFDLIELAALCLDRIDAEEAAHTVRRRAAAARVPVKGAGASSQAA